MKTLYIHIGMPKAGSTSLQTFFTLNRARLQAHGVDYPDRGIYFHKVAHHVWARALKGPRFGFWPLQQNLWAMGRSGRAPIL